MKQKVKRSFEYKRKHFPVAPFGRWLRDYAKEHNKPMTLMSVEAGLSRGILGHYIRDPRRKPSSETILRLSKYTGKPADEIAELAGIAGYKPSYLPIGDSDPAIEKLVKIYKRLPLPMQQYLLRSAYSLDEALKAPKSELSKDRKEEVTYD